MTGVELIAAERQRQIDAEGWTSEHDDTHTISELAIASRGYILASINLIRGIGGIGVPAWWPWSRDWWKPSTDPVINLVKAGALIAAEIDRLQRQSVALEPKEKEGL